MTGPFPADDGSEKYQTKLEVVNAAGGVQWTLVDETLNYGLGYTTPRPFHWSKDGRYLYFTNLAVPDGCAVFTNGSDLYRADLTTGQVAEIVPPWVWWVALSPDEQRVAYLRWNGQTLELVVREMATGDERKIGLEARYTQAGNILWSPDGQALMLTLAANPCDPANWTQSIARVELAALSPTILIRDDKRLLTATAWPEANKVLLTDQDGRTWTMEATTGELAGGGK
jgi:Tol biopolymer transport system component